MTWVVVLSLKDTDVSLATCKKLLEILILHNTIIVFINLELVTVINIGYHNLEGGSIQL